VTDDEDPIPRADDRSETLLLTIPEAARRLGIGRTTAYGLISDGTLEVVRIGRSVRVPTVALPQLVERLRGRR
jgi:excisionase family DNA binding protein